MSAYGIQVADGGETLYVLEANDQAALGPRRGKVLRLVLRLVRDLPAFVWDDRSIGLNRAYNLIVDPPPLISRSFTRAAGRRAAATAFEHPAGSATSAPTNLG